MNSYQDKKVDILQFIKGGLIVSCQARKGWPMYGKEIMAAFACAAKEGGAVGIRATEPDNIIEIKKKVDLPLIGINKKWNDGYSVYITPTYDSAAEIIEAGCDIVALDGTNRLRPNNETLQDIIEKIKKTYPHILIMADISTLEEGIRAEQLGVDLVATTLSGYTEYTKEIDSVNFELISNLANKLKLPVIAEGKINTPIEARKALECGAYAVVVGTAITRPEIITKRFCEKLKEYC